MEYTSKTHQELFKEEKRAKKAAYDKEYRRLNKERLTLDQKLYWQANPERRAKRNKKYRDSHPDKIRETNANWEKNNPEKVRTKSKRYRTRHPEQVLARNAERRARKIHATPGFSNRKEINKIYALARKKSKDTGIKHHVDHIVPLNSLLVCGLHVEWNLQILTMSENCSKSNKSWPDMPDDIEEALKFYYG